MLGTIINAGLILLGSIIGLVFQNRISTRFSKTITQGLAVGMKSTAVPILLIAVGIFVSYYACGLHDLLPPYIMVWY